MRPKGLKEMCIYIRYSMSIIEKAFHYEESKINVVKCNDDIWFKGRDIANALGYQNPGKAIRIHVDFTKLPIRDYVIEIVAYYDGGMEGRWLFFGKDSDDSRMKCLKSV